MTQMEQDVAQSMMELYSGDAERIQHFIKVYTYAELIGKLEGLDDTTQKCLTIGALTHDIGIHTCEEKYGNINGKYQEKEGPIIAEKLLEKLNLEDTLIKRVSFLIAHHHTYKDVDGLDWQILLEADYLVNAYEHSWTNNAVAKAYTNIFRTESGKKLCKSIYNFN